MSTVINRMTRQETDYQYDPTQWTKRRPPEKLLPEHIEFTERESSLYREETEWTRKAYGNGEYRGEWDEFRAGLSDEAPIVVYIHGGWWQWFSPQQFSFLARPFNKKGFAVVMPAYRLAQDWKNGNPMESIVTQMEQAVAEILKVAEQRGSSGVHLVGHSAGGHLVSMLRRTDWSNYDIAPKTSSLLKSAFSLAGLFDLTYLLDSFVNDAIGMTPESARRVSPQLLDSVDRTYCPLHLILPENDTAEFFLQTKEYHQKLLQSDEVCHLHVARSRDHLSVIERMLDHGNPLFEHIVRQMLTPDSAGTALEKTKQASLAWQSSFNSQSADGCAAQYSSDAVMEAKPFGTFQGTAAIRAFWQKLMDDGFAEVEYIDPKFEVLDEVTVKVSSGWRMNKAHGVIHKELWVVEQDGKARLHEDYFEVLG